MHQIGGSRFPQKPPPGAVTWLGHATALLELDGTRVLTDPVLRERVGPLVRIAAPVSPGAIEHVDCVLLSHLHADHADLPSLRNVAAAAPVVAPRHAAQWLRRAGVEVVHELSPGDEILIGRLRVRGTPAIHASRRRPLGPSAQPIGYVVTGSRSVYFAGDTDLFPEMVKLRKRVHVALLPVWGWGRGVGPGHLDPDRAARAAAIISPEVAIPIHWGTFAIGRPARRPTDPGWAPRRFAALAGELAPAVQVRVLEPGERTELD
jgi:L-ascorbate metabolism protein UlaG (beta-lactamase superfamily)